MYPKSCADMDLSQFDLCKLLYTSAIFGKIQLTPTAKLVLFALANHYNPTKQDMYPSQKYLANRLGLGLASVKRAICELRKKGLIIYETKTVNRYKFTKVFFELVSRSGNESSKDFDSKMILEGDQNDINDGIKMSSKQINEKRKEQSAYARNEISINQNEYLSNPLKIQPNRTATGTFKNSSSYGYKKQNQYPYKRKYHHDTQVKGINYQIFKQEKIERGCPLDYSKKDAVTYLNSLPEVLMNCKMANNVREKWNL